MTELNDLFQSLGQNPLIARTGSITLILIVGLVGMRMLQTAVTRSVKETSARYRIRKLVGWSAPMG